MKKAQAIHFWKELRESTEVDAVVNKYKSRSGYPSERTLERYAQVAKGFREGLPLEELGKRTGWSPKYLGSIQCWWEDWQRSEEGSRLLPENNVQESEEKLTSAHVQESGLRVDVGSQTHIRRPGINQDYSSAWVLDISLTNASRTLPVGIKSFVLDVTRGIEGHILNHIGKDIYGSNEEVPFPELALDETLRIEPVTTVRGKLRFLDRGPFSPIEGSVALALIVEESDGRRHTYGMGDRNL